MTLMSSKVIFGMRDDGGSAGFDQEAALLLMGDVSDKILVLLDGKGSRFNRAELAIVKQLHAKHPSKLHFACADNHQSKDAIMRSLVDALNEPSIANSFAAVSPDMADMVPFVTGAVNAQQQSASSLLRGLEV